MKKPSCTTAALKRLAEPRATFCIRRSSVENEHDAASFHTTEDSSSNDFVSSLLFYFLQSVSCSLKGRVNLKRSIQQFYAAINVAHIYSGDS